VAAGESLAIVGPSGCGKTTLLRVLAGLELPDQGDVLIDGAPVRGLSQERAVIFQEPRLLPWLSVLGNVSFGLEVRGTPKPEAQDRARHYIRLVGLADFESAYPRQLSGGMAQRVGIARALTVQPEILLLDEPFGALDAKVRKELRRWLRRLHDELHVTSIFVTHDQEEALEVADRVVLMNQGVIEQVGSPQDVWDQPASPFVYGFLGDVNLFHGRAHEGLLHLDGVAIDSPEHASAQNARAFAYVRPHDLDVHRYQVGGEVDAAGRPQGIVARLDRAIVVGPIARLELMPVDAAPREGHDPLIEAQIPAQQFRELGFQEGETLVVSPRKARVFLQPGA
jgi:sulfate transport system ATP-binding protein